MDFITLFDFILVGYGLFFLYHWYKVRLKGQKPDVKSFLPGDMTLETCQDPKGFQKTFLPNLLLFGLALVTYGSLCIANVRWDFLGAISTPLYFAFGVLMVVWYVLLTRSLRKRFWGKK